MLFRSIDHPGVTASYLVRTKDPLAVRYANTAVLESHAAAVARRLLAAHPGALAALPPPRRAAVLARTESLLCGPGGELAGHVYLIQRLDAAGRREGAASSSVREGAAGTSSLWPQQHAQADVGTAPQHSPPPPPPLLRVSTLSFRGSGAPPPPQPLSPGAPPAPPPQQQRRRSSLEFALGDGLPPPPPPPPPPPESEASLLARCFLSFAFLCHGVARPWAAASAWGALRGAQWALQAQLEREAKLPPACVSPLTSSGDCAAAELGVTGVVAAPLLAALATRLPWVKAVPLRCARRNMVLWVRWALRQAGDVSLLSSSFLLTDALPSFRPPAANKG